MKRIVTGVDASGRSCIAGESAIDDPRDTISAHLLHAVPGSPPPARPPGNGIHHRAGLAPGGLRWGVVHWPPGATGLELHHTDTLDLAAVLAGSIDLVLDDGARTLLPGDFAVVTGIDHSWVAGPQGCTISIVSLGTPPLPDG